MTLLSRKADYALLILSHLYQHPEGANAREIAGRFGLGRPFVANILKELCHNGYVTSHRGVKGGYTLGPSAGDITLAELLEAIGEGFRLTVCSPPADPDADLCSVQTVCTLKRPLDRIHRRIIGVLAGVTLAELFGPADGGSSVVSLDLLAGPPVARCGGPAALAD